MEILCRPEARERRPFVRLARRYDVVVAGAGMAGLCAALAAARRGACVLLVERNAFAGGTSTAGLVSPFMKHETAGRPLVRGLFEELCFGLRRRRAMVDNGFQAAALRVVAEELLAGSGVSVSFDTELLEVRRRGRRVESVSLLTARGRADVEAQVFIDCTGDAQLVCLAGLPWAKGDEATGHTQALTLMFRMADLGVERVTAHAAAHPEDFFDWMDHRAAPDRIVSVGGFFDSVRRAVADGRLPGAIRYIFFTSLPGTGEACFNTTNLLGLDGASSEGLTRAELEGRRQVQALVRFVQEELPGFEEARLLETAAEVGVRETRRVVGDHVMTAEDIRCGSKFDDAVARGCYGIDLHGQQGEESLMEELPAGQWYEIPVRALRVTQSSNVLAAGRCLSSTHEAQGALRIQPTAAATGEACGALAALAAGSGRSVRRIPYPELRRHLAHNLEAVGAADPRVRRGPRPRRGALSVAGRTRTGARDVNPLRRPGRKK